MAVAKLLDAVADFLPAGVEGLRRQLPIEFVEEALAATGVATLRRRRLPAEQVIWLVLGMAIHRDRPIFDVARKLDIALPGEGAIAPSALAQARARVGSEPLKWLFERTAVSWTERYSLSSRWRGLELLAIDGTTLCTADTEQNRAHFGAQEGPTGSSAYPMVRLLVLLQLGTHLMRAARFGPYATSEHDLAQQVRADIPDRSLTIVDRNFHGATLLYNLERDGQDRHWLRRMRSNNVWKVIETLGPGDEIVEMTVSDRARKDDPTLPHRWRMRAIRYKRGGGTDDVLLTSMLDAEKYPAKEIAELYRLRWEIELAYDELKTHLNQQSQTMRSKTVTGVKQELWGLLLAYNLIRLEMARVARTLKVEATRISFLGSLRFIWREWSFDAVASPGAIPRHLKKLQEDLASLLLPPRRANRSFPRALKVRSRRYPRKTPLIAK